MLTNHSGYSTGRFSGVPVDLDCAINAIHTQPAEKSAQLERIREATAASIVELLPELKKILERSEVTGDTAALLRLDSRTYPILSNILGPTFGSGLSLLPVPSIDNIKSASYRNLWSEIEKLGLQPSLCWDKHTTTGVWSGNAGLHRLILCVSLPDVSTTQSHGL